jgi:hypothetical protein
MALEDLVKVAERQVKKLERRIDEQEEVEVGMLDALNRLLNTYRRLVQVKWMEENRRF